MNPLDPEAPFLWALSQNGNFTCQWSFLTSTVFASDGGFKNVVSLDTASPGEAVFSGVFATESAAARDAESKMAETLEAVLSRREGRPAWEDDEDGNWFLTTDAKFIAVSLRSGGWEFSVFDTTTKPPALTHNDPGHSSAEEAMASAEEWLAS